MLELLGLSGETMNIIYIVSYMTVLSTTGVHYPMYETKIKAFTTARLACNSYRNNARSAQVFELFFLADGFGLTGDRPQMRSVVCEPK